MSGPWEQYQSGPWTKYATKPAAPAQPAQTKPSGVDPFSDVVSTLATGMAAPVAGGLAGLAGAALPGPQGQGAEWAQRTQEALTHEPQTSLGKAAGAIASFPGRMLEKVAEPVGSKIGETSPLAGALVKGGIMAAPAALGLRAGRAAPVTREFTPAEQNVIRARDLGLKMTPEEAGAGPISKQVASLAGEPRLARHISQANQPVFNKLIAKDLGLKPDTPLTLDTLKQVRDQAGKGYDAVRKAGRIATDQKYNDSLDALGDKYSSAQKDFPELAKQDVLAVVNGLRKESFDANSGVDMIHQLRESADTAYRSGNKGMARVLRGGADSIEEQIDRTLTQTHPELIKNFRKSRTLIAKSYDAEKSVGGTEEVNPQTYARALAKRKPLTGGAKDVGQFASEFERSSMKPSHQATGVTGYDAVLAILSGLKGIGREALLGGSRPVARSIMSSEPYQKAFIDPRSRVAIEQAITDPKVRRAMGLSTIPGTEYGRPKSPRKPEPTAGEIDENWAKYMQPIVEEQKKRQEYQQQQQEKQQHQFDWMQGVRG